MAQSDDTDQIVLDQTEYKTLRVLVSNTIANLRCGKAVAAYDEVREIENMIEQWELNDRSVDTDTKQGGQTDG